MSLMPLVILAVIQGITEFLPISSSGHLILLPGLMGTEDQGQMLDVAVHVGTLGAVVLYFLSDVKRAFFGFFELIRGRMSENAKLAMLLILATVPVIVAGLVLTLTGWSDAMRSIKVIGWTMLIFGLILYWFDRNSPEVKTAGDWSLKDAVIMGLWQALALIPGTSRSGATITGARALGYTREEGARLAMLMSIPTILASGVLLGLDAASNAQFAALKDAAIGAAFAFVAALIALAFMMRLLRHISFAPYVVYRCVLGVILLWIAYS